MAERKYSILDKYKASLNKPAQKDDAADKSAPKPKPKPKPTQPSSIALESEKEFNQRLDQQYPDVPAKPEKAITPEGRMAVAEKLLSPDVSKLSLADQKAVQAYQRMFPDRKLDLSPVGVSAMQDWYETSMRGDRPEAGAAQQRLDIVRQLEEVYGAQGLPLPEAYNIPASERSLLGGLKEGIADLIPFQTGISEASRKRKVDPDIESQGVGGFLGQVSEAVTYPFRALPDALFGSSTAEPYGSAPPIIDPETGERRERTIRETEPSRVRSEVEAGDRMYGLRDVDVISADLEKVLSDQENKMMDFYEFYAQNNPEKAERDPQYKGLLESQARKHMETKAAQRQRQIEALLKELELIKAYKAQTRRQ
tara:strand:- start:1779 stop:2879 length:1101 start_codon:yes stop_codon:yes gene_type:complete